MALPSGISGHAATLTNSAIALVVRSFRDSLSRVLRVDLHVVEAEIASHDFRRGFAEFEIDRETKFSFLHARRGGFERVCVQRTAARQPNTAETHFNPIEVDRDARFAHCHQDTAELRIASEERG